MFCGACAEAGVVEAEIQKFCRPPTDSRCDRHVARDPTVEWVFTDPQMTLQAPDVGQLGRLARPKTRATWLRTGILQSVDDHVCCARIDKFAGAERPDQLQSAADSCRV